MKIIEEATKSKGKNVLMFNNHAMKTYGGVEV